MNTPGSDGINIMPEKSNALRFLSVVIPAYNERETISEIIDRVKAAEIGIDKEIIIVDDASTDGTWEILKSREDPPDVRVFRLDSNSGKGAALRRGFDEVRGDIVIVQDADLEYNPQEYPKLIDPIIEGRADVVYGSRFVGSESHRVHFFWHSVGNSLLTTLSNMFTNLNLTDMETCYKAFRTEILRNVVLVEDGFGFEPEVTAKMARLRVRVYEVGISYSGRDYSEGKKIGWKDAFRALWCILKYGLLKR